MKLKSELGATMLILATLGGCSQADESSELGAGPNEVTAANEADADFDPDCSAAETVQELVYCRTNRNYDPETFSCGDLPEEMQRRSCAAGGTPIRRRPNTDTTNTE